MINEENCKSTLYRFWGPRSILWNSRAWKVSRNRKERLKHRNNRWKEANTNIYPLESCIISKILGNQIQVKTDRIPCDKDKEFSSLLLCAAFGSAIQQWSCYGELLPSQMLLVLAHLSYCETQLGSHLAGQWKRRTNGTSLNLLLSTNSRRALLAPFSCG